MNTTVLVIGGAGYIGSHVTHELCDQGYSVVILDNLSTGFSENIETEFTLNPEDFLSRYLSPYGAGFSLEPRIFQSAWFRPHNISEEIENLFLVGAGTHPGAGIPSVVTSAEVMAKLIPDASYIRLNS